jgi:hypothetical protein
MRRGFAILLAVVFHWMLILPVLAFTNGTNVPACCRKTGKHHCQMMQKDVPLNPDFSAIGEKCPYWPQISTAPHIESFVPATQQAIFAGLTAHPAGSPQTEAGYRASYYRSKQKRGPPSFFLS